MMILVLLINPAHDGNYRASKRKSISLNVNEAHEDLQMWKRTEHFETITVTFGENISRMGEGPIQYT